MTAAQFTFQPSGSSGCSGTTFTTESALAAALSTTGSSGALLLFDLSAVGSSSYTFTTVGALNLGQYTTFANAAGEGSISLIFANGTQFSYPPVAINSGVSISITQSAAAVAPSVANVSALNLFGTSSISTTSGPFYSGAGNSGSELVCNLYGNSSVHAAVSIAFIASGSALFHFV